MKILVTVKQVPDTSGKVAVNPDGTLDRASMQTIINPDDLNAVEAALALKDELGCKVVAFTMGPPPAEGMLRELMAMGVDEGVLITAREFGGSDTYATSQIIAAGIDTYGVEKDDIILAGRQAIYGKPLVTMTYETLKDHPLIDKSTIGLAGSPTNILTSFTPPQKGAGMMLEGAGKETTDKLAGILAAKHII